MALARQEHIRKALPQEHQLKGSAGDKDRVSYS